jgi:acylphosphatase
MWYNFKSMEEARAHLFIEGRVQGVFYRAFTRELAHSLGLKGWVKNLRDGRVEAVFEGKKELIEQAIKECYIGPPGARVSNIDVNREPFIGDLKGFSIRY